MISARAIINGIRGVSGSEVGREVALAFIAGLVSWYVTEKLTDWKNKKNG